MATSCAIRSPPIRTASELINGLASEGTPIGASSAILTRQVAHLTRLVDELLDVARITQGRAQIEPREVRLADVIDMAVEQAKPFFARRGQSFDLDIPDRSLYVIADPTRMAQVFGNLLHNAAKYTPDGGSVAMAARAEGDQAVVRVCDTGSGIPPEQLAQIFELFSQLPRSLARSEGGLGIGLTLAKRVVEAHGGTIEARREGSDNGSVFVVHLTLAGSTVEMLASLIGAPRAQAP